MKKIFRAFLASVLAFGSTAVFAQSVKFDKTISGPSDEGVYTINLEAYVTGAINVTKTPAPADIILVLDRSGSMDDNIAGQETSGRTAHTKRINILKEAVQAFVDTTKASSARIKVSDRDSYGGHRIAIVWFSGSVYTSIQGLNAFHNVENLSTVKASGTGRQYTPAEVRYNNVNLLGVTANGGTYTNYAMQRAETILSGQTYSDKPNRSRVVVFFTDGQPGSGQHGDNWTAYPTDLNVANECIEAADNIKTSEDYPATVYSVGMFNKTATTVDATTTYLSYTSSDFTGKTEMPSSSSQYVSVSQDKSIIVSSSSALANVFDSISQSSGGEYTAASSSSVLVDIVTSSFYIPKDADLGNVEVYKVACTKASATAITSFETDESKWDPITDDVDLDVDKDTGEVSVTNFDYGAEWCGWDASKNEPHGHKLVLKIPILANTDAVGGPNVQTNAEGSKLTIKNEAGDTLSTHNFVSPAISLPVNIHIMKKDLDLGESAKFSILRTTLPVTDTSTWDYVTSVFVTNGPSSAFEVAEDDNKSYPVTYVRGLPSAIKKTVDGELKTIGYVYKIVEDDWGWSYEFQKATGIGAKTQANPTGAVTVSDVDQVTSDLFINNPIVFWNKKEDNIDVKVRHAESKVTNIFLGSGTIKYDDSKDNGRSATK